MGQLFLIAFRNLVQHRRRTLLLGGAITGVTLLLVLVLGLTHGVSETMMRSATTVSTGHLNVGGFYKVTSGMAAPVVTDYERVREIVKHQPGVAFVVDRGRGWARVVSDTGSMQLGINGIDIRQEKGLREVLSITSGNLDDMAKKNGLLIFEQQAEKLGVKVGDSVTLSAPTPRGVNNTMDAVIVAIARDVGLLSNFSVFLNNDGLRGLYQLNPHTTGALQVYLNDIKQASQMKPKLRQALEQAGYTVMADDPRPFFMKFDTVNREAWTGQRLDVTTWEDETSFFSWTVLIVNLLSGLLIAVLIGIISVGVMNALWIAIRERTREVGTLRAIGMQKGRVLMMFLIEGFLLGLMSTVLGAVLSVVVAAVVNALNQPVPSAVQLFVMSNTIRFLVTPGAVTFAVLFLTGCTTFVSLFPSFIAARMKPITAMHHIG
ncbi:MAG: ABC transporter permease [Myxococcaceae bacterium]|nr:ABC transporter permease [Myxococcaceae bacterium]